MNTDPQTFLKFNLTKDNLHVVVRFDFASVED
jgi:hypothetical protein